MLFQWADFEQSRRFDDISAIAQRAGVEGAEIHWGDETALVNTDVRCAVMRLPGRRRWLMRDTCQKLSMVIIVTNQGKARWMTIEETFNSDKLIEFLKAQIRDASRKVFLILDNLRVHHSKPVKPGWKKTGQMVEVFYLPSYSPELNLEERLNADLKYAIGAKVPARTKPKLKAAAKDPMVMLENNPERSNPISRTHASSMLLNTICSPGQ